LLTVLATFDDVPVRREPVNEHLWNVVLGTLYSTTYAHILGTIQDTGAFDFHFFRNGCQETTVLEILKRLSSISGSLVLYKEIATTPVLMTPTIAVEQVHTIRCHER